MADSLFEILLHLFEKTLLQLKAKHQTTDAVTTSEEKRPVLSTPPQDGKVMVQLQYLKSAEDRSIRIFTPDEQMKLTKSSLQFLVRMLTWGVVNAALFELIVHRLLLSESRFVSLIETKWTIRNTLADTLSAEQLAFLDLILYQKEDGMVLH